MTVDLKITGTLSVARLYPNDVLVVEIPNPGQATADSFVEVRAQIQRVFPNHEVLVMAGASLKVVRS